MVEDAGNDGDAHQQFHGMGQLFGQQTPDAGDHDGNALDQNADEVQQLGHYGVGVAQQVGVEQAGCQKAQGNAAAEDLYAQLLLRGSGQIIPPQRLQGVACHVVDIFQTNHLLFRIQDNGGLAVFHHPDVLDIRSVGIAVTDAELSLVGTFDFA